MTTEHTPGTWAWACAQLVEGKTVNCPSTLLKLRLQEDYLSEEVGGSLYPNPEISLEDLTATDWEVVE